MSNVPNGGDAAVLATGGHSPNHHNKFDLSYKFAAPERFGEVSPFFIYRGLEDDKNVVLYSGSSVDSMTLHAPILQDIKKNRDFYMVPMKAILPNTWDLIQALPTHGDDINASEANCLISLYIPDEGSIFYSLNLLGYHSIALLDGETQLPELIIDDLSIGSILSWFRWLVLLNGFFSRDSLFAAMRIPLSDMLGLEGDQRMQNILVQAWRFYHGVLKKAFDYSQAGTTVVPTRVSFLDSEGNVVSRASYNFDDISDRMQFFYDFVENSNIRFDDLVLSDFKEAFNDFVSDNDLYPMLYLIADTDYYLNYFGSSPNLSVPINIANVIAYQLIYHEYFTNDKIDWIYSAKMYRELFDSIVLYFGFSPYFDYNGQYLHYDSFSAYCLRNILQNVDDLNAYELIVSLIYRHRSLRYIDYFCGARPQPLANGVDTVEVNSGVASVVDITKRIQEIRLRMAVNRVGRKAKGYINKVLHGKYRQEDDVPVKIGHLSEQLYQEETQNTASDQLVLDNSRTATIKSRAKNFGFETDCDVNTIIMGVSSYEITRFYDRGLDPFARKVDRFDMFNPFLQYTGDQPISMSELNAGLDVEDYFGYTTKDMEYKVAVDYCIGDFRDALSGWIFTQPAATRDTFINSDFIRAHQCELDRYYVALTGSMPWKRYHFISKYSNYVSSVRNMVVAPNIIG